MDCLFDFYPKERQLILDRYNYFKYILSKYEHLYVCVCLCEYVCIRTDVAFANDITMLFNVTGMPFAAGALCG